MEIENTIRIRDIILIGNSAWQEEVVVIHIYPSGKLKVRCNNGHIKIIAPDEVVGNCGYQSSEDESVMNILINSRYYGKNQD